MRTACVLVLLAAAVSAEPSELARWIPAEARLYVEMPDVGRTRERVARSAFGAMWESRELRPFVERLVDPDAEDGDSPWTPKGGVRVVDILDLLRGPVVFALVPDRAGEDVPVLLFDFGAKADEAERLMRRYEEADEPDDDVSVRRRSEEIRGVTLWIKETYREGVEEPELSCEFRRGSVMAYAKGLGVARRVLAEGLDGGPGSLAGAELLRVGDAALGDAPDVRAWVAPALWLEALDESTRTVLDTLGLSGVRGVSSALRLEENGLRCDVLAHCGEDRAGVLALVGKGAGRQGPPAFVPPDCEMVFCLATDFQKLFDGIVALVAAFQPGADAQVRAFLDAAKQRSGVDLYADVLGSFAGEFSAVFMPDPDVGRAVEAGAPPAAVGYLFGSRGVFVHRLSDVAKVKAVLAKGVESGNLVAEEEFQGIPLYRAGQTIAVVGEHLIHSVRADVIKQLLLRHGKDLPSLAGSAEWRGAAASLPPRRTITLYSDPYREGGLSFLLLGLRDALGEASEDAPPPPGPDFWRRHLGPWSLALASREEGIQLTLFHGLKVPE